MATFGWETAIACALGVACLALLPRWLKGASGEWLLAALSASVLLWWQPAALWVTLALTGVTWLALRQGKDGPAPRVSSGVAITVLVATLAGFKYLPSVMPLGLSFTVFRLIGVVLDVNALRLTLPFSRLVLLSLLFPTFPAGPITTVRSLKALDGGEPRSALLSRAGWRIVQGLSRKALMADPLHSLVIGPWLKGGVAHLEPYQGVVLPVLFGLYIYWDFAAYSDLAIGMALLLGYQVPENFDRPYASGSLIEFWRRWHITLSEWIRGRLMMKMAGRRATAWRLHGATLVSMALCGLWHGTGIGYLLWGIWHGLGLVGLHLFAEAQRAHPRLRTLGERFVGDTVSTALTFAFVTVGWIVFFLSPGEAMTMTAKALEWRGGSGVALWIPLGVVAGLLLAHLSTGRLQAGWLRLPPIARLSARTVLLGVLTYVLAFTSGGRQDFFYAQF